MSDPDDRVYRSRREIARQHVLTRRTFLGAAVGTFVAACSDDGTGPGRAIDGVDPLACNLDLGFLADGGVPRDGIPALTDPPFTQPDLATYLDPDDRVVGIDVAGEALAIPHRILWQHEIVNLNRGGQRLAVTYCPLTGSAIVFDRNSIGGDEFGVSGLLFQNNLIMYNRRTDESLWPQMMTEARCGPSSGTRLVTVPALEVRWVSWRSLRPTTQVVSDEANLSRNYRDNPYEGYEDLGTGYSYPMPLDRRRDPKERVLGLPGPNGGSRAFPFLALREQGVWAAVSTEVDGQRSIVFWDANSRGAHAYDPTVAGDTLTFTASATGIVDDQSGSRWGIDGRARSGPLAGETLAPRAAAYVAFWGAWAAFNPNTQLWTT